VTGDQTGMLLLAGTFVVATVGVWDLLAAGATREELRERATGERAPRSSAPGRATSCRSRSTARRCRFGRCTPR
jgi:hypothetical protein